jgi:membrane protein DedA with SNARE-associated domain
VIDFLGALMARLAEAPWLQGVVAALATFILEDPTTVGSGLLVADGKMAFATAFLGVSAGIALGDLGLYAGGRWLGPRLAGRGPLTFDRLDRAERWFQTNVIKAVVFSRFVPGMRLPTYVGAGLVRAPFWRFAATAIVASVVWTLILLTATIALGQQILPILGRWRWPVAAVALVLLVVLQRRVGSAAKGTESEEKADSPIVSTFEFWPPWLFYIPVAFHWMRLAIRHRGLLLPTAANPSIEGGGFIGESKSKILELVPPENRRWVADWTTAIGGQDAAGILQGMRDQGLDFPVVAKPDIGQRGAGVQPLGGLDELVAYSAAFPAGETFLIQELAGGGRGGPQGVYLPAFGDVREAGVMWWREPGKDRGAITSMTLKVFPQVTGDGRRTLSELIDADSRARHIAALYQKRHRNDLERVLADGEVFELVFAGNHCQGAIFRDGNALVTPELSSRLEAIAGSIPEFWFGRFDIRFDDFELFLQGEDFKIIEINGASAEATHIWDASITLREAYRVLFQQFDALFEIGASNRRRGFEPLSIGRFWRDLTGYRKMARGYPDAK